MQRIRFMRACTVAVTLGVAGACSSPEQPAGKEMFERDCGSCHADGRLPGRLAADLSEPRNRIALDQFLAQHHADDPMARAEIIEYLAAQEK